MMFRQGPRLCGERGGMKTAGGSGLALKSAELSVRAVRRAVSAAPEPTGFGAV
jgi:hypothetical protein